MKFSVLLNRIKVNDKIRRKIWENSLHFTVADNGGFLRNNTNDTVVMGDGGLKLTDMKAEDWEVMEEADVTEIEEGRPFIAKSDNNRYVVIDGVSYCRYNDQKNFTTDTVHYLDGEGEKQPIPAVKIGTRPE